MEATQMNVRLDRAVKRAGDAVLEARGCTPSRLVRALWEYLSVQGRVPDALERMLGQEELDAGDGPAAQDWYDAGARLVSSFYEGLGVSEPQRPAPDYAALRDEWADERLAKWSLS